MWDLTHIWVAIPMTVKAIGLARAKIIYYFIFQKRVDIYTSICYTIFRKKKGNKKMKIETKPIITFTEKEYETFNKACMMLNDLINGDYRAAFAIIMKVNETDLDILYGMFDNIVDYVEEHRE